MTDTCCSVPAAGCTVCELPSQVIERAPRAAANCPRCGEKGKPVQGQTVRALLAVSLREVLDVAYWFCRTPTCPVVYFSPDVEQTFTTEQVRERVYQKEPEANRCSGVLLFPAYRGRYSCRLAGSARRAGGRD